MNSKQLVEKIRDAGFKPRSYAGRGMFGKECIAVSVQPTSEGREVDLPRGNRTDSLGKGQIYYWPEHKWEAEYGVSQ